MATVAKNPRRSRAGLILLPFVVVSLAVLLALGTWQVQRLAWKEDLIATIEDRTARAPVALAEALSSERSIADMEYLPVLLRGTFVHDAERHFFATHRGASGYYIYTPLRMADGDHVFVNRGFVPYDRKDPATRAEGQVEGEVEIVGLLRPALAEKPSWIVPENTPETNVFYWKDIRAMAESSGLPADADILGFFVDADDTPSPGILPVGGVTIIEMPNSHLQYAVTWYGLAAALLAVSVAWYWRRRRGGGPKGP